MSAGDRIINPDNGGYAIAVITDESVQSSSGRKAAALMFMPVDAAGASITPATATQIGPTNEAAPAGDTATSGLNGRLQRIAQRITSALALLTTTDANVALLVPAAKCDAVTPNDAADLAHNTRGLMVSVAGDVKVDFVTTGSGLVLTGLQPGIVYPFQIKRVHSTSTTATGILALY